MKYFDKISSTIWLLIAFFFIWFVTYVPMGRISVPGPGFMPFWVGVTLAILSIILLGEATVRKPSAEEQVKFLSGEGKWLRVVFTVVPLLIFAFIVETLGFIVSTLLLIFFLFRFISNRKWWVAITATILVTLAAHLIFRVVLKVQLPYGIFRS